MTGRDVVCLSSQDWNEVWTRKQRFMRRLARKGNRVLYVNLQLSWASVGYLRKDWRRPFRWLSGPTEIEPRLYLATLPLAPPGFQMALALNSLTNVMMRSVLRRWIRQLHFNSPVLWTYNPYSDGLVGRLGERCAVYECVDEFSASRGLVRASVVRELERRVLGAVDLTIVTHENLYKSKQPLTRRIRLIPNAAEIEHFAQASDQKTPVAPEIARLPRPIVGVVGTLQYWIDFDLLRFLAERRPGWQFVLVGPRGRLARVDQIEGLPNVHLLGRRPYEELPSLMKGFDACLNPYVIDGTALNCSPLKLYEYVASGRPVVSVDMPEARKFAAVIGIGRTYDEILARLDEAMQPAAVAPEAVAARMHAVSGHSWDCRFEEMEQALADAIAAREGYAVASNTLSVASAAARHE